MRRHMSCLIVLLVVTSFGPANPTDAADISLGLRAGLNITAMTGDVIDTLAGGIEPDADYKVRGMIGAFATFNLSDRWAVQPEIFYTQRAGTWEWIETYGDITVTTTQVTELRYWEIPVFLKFTVPQAGKLEPFFFAGPAVAILASSSHEVEASADSSGTRIGHFLYYSTHIHNAKNTVAEIIVGAGFDWKVGLYQLSFEGRYTRSLSALFEDVADFDAVPVGDAVLARFPSGEALKLNHSAFSIVIGFSFPI